MKPILLFALFSLIAIESCVTPKNLYKKGDLNGAVYLASQKLKTGNTSDKTKLMLEQAYNEMVQFELKKITQLKLEGNPANWEQILKIYQSIDYKQNIVKPLLPIYIKKEYRNADIKIINIDDEMAQAKNNAAEFYYSKANNLLSFKNKLKARDAYFYFLKTKEIYADYKDINLKMDTAKRWGTNLVLIDYKNNSANILPKEYIQELMRISTAELNTTWAEFTTRIGDRNPDNIIVVNIKNIAISPEQIKERTFTESRSIQDGYTFAYDTNGRIKRDANGKEVKNPKYVNVYAVVKEIAQHKQGFQEGTFDVFNYSTTELYTSEPFRTDLVFDNIAHSFIGDRRALSDAVRNNLGNRPMPFPTNEQMLMDGIQTIKSQLRAMIQSKRNIVER